MSVFTEWISKTSWGISREILARMMDAASMSAVQEKALSPAALSPAGAPVAAKRYEIHNGAAVIPVIGPIFPRVSVWSRIFGGVALSELAPAFTDALKDPQVKAVVLNFDSPGGDLTGISEMAEMIYQARGKKPIVSYIYGAGMSAAYWIAAAADQVIVADTAEVGSIGVIATWTDTRERDQKAGVRSIEIVSSLSPKKRPDPATDAGKAQVQKTVDDLAAVMVSAIAKYRGVTADHVKTSFGQGDIVVGLAAVAAGMADSLGNLDGVMTGAIQGRFKPGDRSGVLRQGAGANAGAGGQKKGVRRENTAFVIQFVQSGHPVVARGPVMSPGPAAAAVADFKRSCLGLSAGISDAEIAAAFDQAAPGADVVALVPTADEVVAIATAGGRVTAFRDMPAAELDPVEYHRNVGAFDAVIDAAVARVNSGR